METKSTIEPGTVVLLEKLSVLQGKNIVLNNVTLKMKRGEFAYLIGETGSGKSSLLKILYGDIKAVDGNAYVAGIDLHNLKFKEIPRLRRKLGIVFQDFQLLSDRTVHENLMFVLGSTGWKELHLMNKRIEEVLEDIGLSDKGNKMPHQLSGGEQQRVVIARALLNRPELILADEPTGNLDPNTSEDILKLLINISKAGTAVLMATHDYSLFRRFPARTYRCIDGQLVEKVFTAEDSPN